MLSALVLTLGLASCSSDKEGEELRAEDKSVYIKLDVPVTRGVPALEEGPAPFNSGILYMVNSKGAITKYYKIVKNATVESEIDLDEITSTGVLLDNVPGQSSQVALVGNVEKDASNTALPLTGLLSAVKAKMLSVGSQSGDERAVDVAALYGEKALTPTGNENEWEAAIELSPIISRIEIEGITCGGIITSFQVDGIFINSFYPQSPINGVLKGIENFGSENDNYLDTNAEYPTALYDYNAGGIGELNEKTYKPKTADYVWAYNMFSTSAAEKTGDEYPTDNVPHIVVRLSNIVTSDKDVTYEGTHFLTVAKYTDDKGKDITPFEPGKNYTLSAEDFKFNEEHITPNPEIESIKVKVTVSVIDWENKPVKPSL